VAALAGVERSHLRRFGDAQSIWAAMTALAFIYPRGAVVFFGFAAFISASRFITGVHFISDVVMGAWTAVICAVIWRWRYERGGIPIALVKPNSGPASP
jgi:membrane-associated phospholipid phosphatase